ncbi:MAG: hypothetical protein AB2693_29460 [Candidatus Thiodiazotropha sp.]
MAELEVSIDPQEEATFFQNHRPLWPFVPSVCTVPSCLELGKFSSFRDFRDHWHEKHNEFISHYKCQACGKLFSNNKHAKSHTKARIHKGQTVTIKYIQDKNNFYIDSMDFLPYQLGSKEDQENSRSTQRHIAREKRRREQLEQKEDFSKIPYFGDGICRDERVVERNGQLYRDTNLWSKKESDRKRIKLARKDNLQC